MLAAHLIPWIDFAEFSILQVVAVVREAHALLELEQIVELLAGDGRRAGKGLRKDNRAAISICDLHFEVGVLDGLAPADHAVAAHEN